MKEFRLDFVKSQPHLRERAHKNQNERESQTHQRQAQGTQGVNKAVNHEQVSRSG
jgi:hypothetical protein